MIVGLTELLAAPARTGSRFADRNLTAGSQLSRRAQKLPQSCAASATAQVPG